MSFLPTPQRSLHTDIISLKKILSSTFFSLTLHYMCCYNTNMNEVYGLWYGGPSYRQPYMEDLEEFESLEKAKKVFESRLYNQREFPDVSEEDCVMQIFFDDPSDSYDPYPDLLLKFNNEEVVEELC